MKELYYYLLLLFTCQRDEKQQNCCVHHSSWSLIKARIPSVPLFNQWGLLLRNVWHFIFTTSPMPSLTSLYLCTHLLFSIYFFCCYRFKSYLRKTTHHIKLVYKPVGQLHIMRLYPNNCFRNISGAPVCASVSECGSVCELFSSYFYCCNFPAI